MLGGFVHVERGSAFWFRLPALGADCVEIKALFFCVPYLEAVRC
jgi:hypothetical protein